MKVRIIIRRAILLAAAALTGCGNTLNCEIKGDNIRGHIMYGDGVTRTSSRRLVVQVSTDAFSSVTTKAEEIVNVQGLIAIPYTYCAPSEQNLTFRAFEDTNSNGSWDAGEPAGRHDGTSTGNAALTVHNLPEADPDAVPEVEWEIDYGVNIMLDDTAAQ